MCRDRLDIGKIFVRVHRVYLWISICVILITN